ncbi:MAG: hypothetical protein ACRDIB_04950 [Ardenticatenaceae bacterium]
MSSYPITLPVPTHIYERARELADATKQPVEKILVEQLEEAFSEPLPRLPTNEQDELEALAHLSDAALWTIAREQMPEAQQLRLQALMDANSSGAITEPQHQELHRLVEQGQQLMLRKAQAAALLTERGHHVTPRHMAVGDE